MIFQLEINELTKILYQEKVFIFVRWKKNFLNFSLILKWIAANCSEEWFPYRKVPKKNGIHHIRGGSPSIYISFVFHRTKMNTLTWHKILVNSLIQAEISLPNCEVNGRHTFPAHAVDPGKTPKQQMNDIIALLTGNVSGEF